MYYEPPGGNLQCTLHGPAAGNWLKLYPTTCAEQPALAWMLERTTKSSQTFFQYLLETVAHSVI